MHVCGGYLYSVDCLYRIYCVCSHGHLSAKTCRFLVCPLVFQDSGYKLDDMPEWRNGRRTRLKIWHPFGYTGSTPVSGIRGLHSRLGSHHRYVRGLTPTVWILPPLTRFNMYHPILPWVTPTAGFLSPLRGSLNIKH